jgi:outer membrane lipoprotein-sorting protein
MLTALAIVVALATDFLMLPALLMVGHRTAAESDSSTSADQSPRRKPMNSILRPGSITTALMTVGLAAATLLVAGSMTSTKAAGPKVEKDAAVSRATTEVDSELSSDGSAVVLADTEALLAQASTPEEKGLAIAARADRSDRNFGNSRVEMEMVLRNKTGKESRRTLILSTLEIPDENYGDKSVIVFDSPADIDGTALLSHAQILNPDDQWLYLPALKRVKRISSVNKSGPFVGSEFAFEDFTSLELNKYEYTYLRSEPCGDMVCDVLERRPRYEHSGYAEQIAWIDQDAFQVRKVEFHDRRGDLLKTLVLDEYRVYGDGWWRPHLLAMTNHKTGKSTDLVYANYEFDIGLDDNDFVKGMLQRIR